MAIDKLNEQLYSRQRPEQKPEVVSDPFHPVAPHDTAGLSVGRAEAFKPVEGSWLAQHQAAIWFWTKVLGGILIVFGAGVGWYLYQQSLFDDERVSVSIEGPKEVDSSQLARFTIAYENDNRSALKDAELLIYYPEYFRPEPRGSDIIVENEYSKVNLGRIEGGDRRTIDFYGKFYGGKDSVAYVRALLRYAPEKLESRYEAAKEVAVGLRSSSVRIEAEAPLEVATGGMVEYLISYTNTSDQAVESLRVKLEPPAGFSFIGADPQPSEGANVWYLGALSAGATGKISVRGNLEGQRGEGRIMKAMIGTVRGDGTFISYAEASQSTRIVASPLSIRQTVNGGINVNANPGDQLYYSIDYKNEGQIGLRNVIITVDMKSRVLDLPRLRLEKGAFDSSRQVFTWKASDIPQLANLAPGASGNIRFTVPVLESLPLANDNDKNPVVQTVAKIDSPDVPSTLGQNKVIATNALTVRVNTRPLLSVGAYYLDDQLPNQGPIPPKVGQETTYTIRWKAGNTTNDLREGTVTANLPTGVRWVGKTSPGGEKITYNSRTNQIVWDLGSVPAGAGVYQPAREVRFQVGLKPEPNQVGSNPVLIGESVFAGKDVFTGDTVRSVITPRSTSILEDTSVPSTGYRVEP